MFAERIEKVKKTKLEIELKKTVDCFIDGHSNYDSNLVAFRKNRSNKQNCLLQLARVSKEYKTLVKKEIPKQKLQVFYKVSDFK